MTDNKGMNEKRVTLKPIVHDRATTLWCGPAVLAAISGQPTSAIHRVLQGVTGRATIKGVCNQELCKAALKLGHQLIALPPNDVISLRYATYPTLARWTRQNAALLAQHTVIIQVTGHYVAVSGRTFVDSHTKVPVSLKRAPHRRCRVQSVYLVRKVEGAVVEIPAPAPRRVDASRKERTEAKALAALHGIPIEPYENGVGEFWVYPPPGLDSEAKDRNYSDHLAFDWSDVLERVKGYVADLTLEVA